jgi:sugar O-acyltransferase (sialic acid O-acetyltransferase NeuD family)
LQAGSFTVVGFLDDDVAQRGETRMGFQVLGPPEDWVSSARQFGFSSVLVAIGDNHVRAHKVAEVRRAGLSIMGVVHPSAVVSPFAEFAEGVVILAGAVVNPGAMLEENVHVNTRASVDHDNLLRANCHIYPGATLAGNVTIGAFSYVGSGAVIIPGKQVGTNAYVAAGAVVIQDVPDGVTVAGVPAIPLTAQSRSHSLHESFR